jgi:hypothetical protein
VEAVLVGDGGDRFGAGAGAEPHPALLAPVGEPDVVDVDPLAPLVAGRQGMSRQTTAPRCSSNLSLPAKAGSFLRISAPLPRLSYGSPFSPQLSSENQALDSCHARCARGSWRLGEELVEAAVGVPAGELAAADLAVRVVAHRHLDQVVGWPRQARWLTSENSSPEALASLALGELGAARPPGPELIVGLDDLAQLGRQVAQVLARACAAASGLAGVRLGPGHARDLAGQFGEGVCDVGQLVGGAVEVAAGRG